MDLREFSVQKRKLLNTEHEMDDNHQPKSLKTDHAFSSIYNEESGKHIAIDVLFWDRPFYVSEVTYDGTKIRLSHKIKPNYFPFLLLPPEVRNIIYSVVLFRSSKYNPIEIRGGRQKLRKPNTKIWRKERDIQHLSALVKVNRQIHQEAVGFLYENYFAFNHLYGLKAFLLEIGVNARQMQHIAIKAVGSSCALNMVYLISSILISARNFETLRFCTSETMTSAEVASWFNGRSNYFHPSKFDEVKALIKIMGRGKGLAAGLEGLSFMPWCPESSPATAMQDRDAEVRKDLIQCLGPYFHRNRRYRIRPVQSRF